MEKDILTTEKQGFGKVCNLCEEVVTELKNLYKNDLKLSKEFEEAHKKYFELYDNKNSERIYNAIINTK